MVFRKHQNRNVRLTLWGDAKETGLRNRDQQRELHYIPPPGPIILYPFATHIRVRMVNTLPARVVYNSLFSSLVKVGVIVRFQALLRVGVS